MKKAGVLIGCLLVGLAILLFFISTRISKPDVEPRNDEDKELIVVTDVPKETETDKKVNEVTKPIIVTTTVTPSPELEKPKDKTKITVLTEEGLGKPNRLVEETAAIIGKKVMLLETDVTSSEDKILTYCFEVVTESGRNLTLFVTGKAYQEYSALTKLKVSYTVYKNDIGVEFPMVQNVTTVE